MSIARPGVSWYRARLNVTEPSRPGSRSSGDSSSSDRVPGAAGTAASLEGQGEPRWSLPRPMRERDSSLSPPCSLVQTHGQAGSAPRSTIQGECRPSRTDSFGELWSAGRVIECEVNLHPPTRLIGRGEQDLGELALGTVRHRERRELAR